MRSATIAALGAIVTHGPFPSRPLRRMSKPFPDGVATSSNCSSAPLAPAERQGEGSAAY